MKKYEVTGELIEELYHKAWNDGRMGSYDAGRCKDLFKKEIKTLNRAEVEKIFDVFGTAIVKESFNSEKINGISIINSAKITNLENEAITAICNLSVPELELIHPSLTGEFIKSIYGYNKKADIYIKGSEE